MKISTVQGAWRKREIKKCDGGSTISMQRACNCSYERNALRVSRPRRREVTVTITAASGCVWLSANSPLFFSFIARIQYDYDSQVNDRGNLITRPTSTHHLRDRSPSGQHSPPASPFLRDTRWNFISGFTPYCQIVRADNKFTRGFIAHARSPRLDRKYSSTSRGKLRRAT